MDVDDKTIGDWLAMFVVAVTILMLSAIVMADTVQRWRRKRAFCGKPR